MAATCRRGGAPGSTRRAARCARSSFASARAPAACSGVWFRDEARLGVLVPVRMWEWFEKIPIAGETWPADLETLATYTGLKLFTVTTEEGEAKPQ